MLKQLGARPELVHCHATLTTLEALMTLVVTAVGVGGAEVVQYYEFINNCYTHYKCLPLAGRKVIIGSLVLSIRPPLA